MGTQTYLIALGSNRPGRYGRPHEIVALVSGRLALLVHASESGQDAPGGYIRDCTGTAGTRCSRVITSLPLGPGRRRYANAVAIVESDLAPPEMLARLKAIERAFGRRPGRRWGDRVIDLDIIAWSGGIWSSKGLGIPHPGFRKRGFVLGPLVDIAPDWRDPVSGLSPRHLVSRLARKIPDRG